ncbi:hypothetical protein CDAR_208531 [Caerostris darwini]|uniref:Secreted protein n=1 Tax=Caerostris darwini TaxID=1538125 RepID=A0AAV4W693_9ARAC|nr:hypothetical protein CDAR_208531 [Caerostris darwini]
MRNWFFFFFASHSPVIVEPPSIINPKRAAWNRTRDVGATCCDTPIGPASHAGLRVCALVQDLRARALQAEAFQPRSPVSAPAGIYIYILF